MATALKTKEKMTPNTYLSQQILSGDRQGRYYSASEFRELAQADLKRLFKKHGRI